MEDAKIYLGIVFVFAAIFWAAEAAEYAVVRRGLLILRLWLKAPAYRQVSIRHVVPHCIQAKR